MTMVNKNKYYKKTVIINRAVPGSGKTIISRCITQALINEGLQISCHSTDDFFMINGRYCFDINKLYDYHVQNLDNFTQDLKKGYDVVICDNTNILPWQCESYTECARQFGYQVIFLNFQPRRLEDHVRAQQITPEKLDAHGVSEDDLKIFIEDFICYDPLLNKESEVDPRRQFHFTWDNKEYCPVMAGPAKHFDSDYVITIFPNEYHSLKETIGEKILGLIVKEKFQYLLP